MDAGAFGCPLVGLPATAPSHLLERESGQYSRTRARRSPSLPARVVWVAHASHGGVGSGLGQCGDANELGDTGGGPGKSSLFFVRGGGRAWNRLDRR